MLKNEKSANRNEHQNRKTEVFWHMSPSLRQARALPLLFESKKTLAFDCTFQEGGKGGSRSRFKENKTVLPQFTKNKIGISRFTGKKRESLKVTYRYILKNYVQRKACLVVVTFRPLRVLRDAKRSPKTRPDHVVATGINHDVIVTQHHLLRNYGCRK